MGVKDTFFLDRNKAVLVVIDVQEKLCRAMDGKVLEQLTRNVTILQEAAKEAKQISAAVAALTAKAKLAGLWVDRSETENVNTNYVVSGDPVDSVEDWEAEHAPKH